MTDAETTTSDVIMRLIGDLHGQYEALGELKQWNLWQANEITRLTDENIDLKHKLGMKHPLDSHGV